MTAGRFSVVVDGFGARVGAVTDWDAPTPCEGWVARDVVGHLVGWVPGFLSAFAGLELAVGSDASDPVAAWNSLAVGLRRALGDDAVATRTVQGPLGETTVAGLVDQFVTTDIAVHTWDLARSNGLDDRVEGLDPEPILAAAEQMDAALRSSGHYGPWVHVPDDGDPQDRLLGFFGRDPAWRPSR